MNTYGVDLMGRRRRRRHSAEFKAAVIRECLKPGVSIAAVALALYPLEGRWIFVLCILAGAAGGALWALWPGLLRLKSGTSVQVVEGVSLADNQPIAAFRSVFPAARFPDLLALIGKTGSITQALTASGLADYTRAETRLTAQLADPVLAGALLIRPGAPVLRTVAVNVDPMGVPVELGTTWFAGERVTLTVVDQA